MGGSGNHTQFGKTNANSILCYISRNDHVPELKCLRTQEHRLAGRSPDKESRIYQPNVSLSGDFSKCPLEHKM